MTQNIFKKSVKEIMTEYSPVYPVSRKWADTVEYLLKEEPEIIDELKRQYLLHGEFREPVIILLDEDDDESDEELIEGSSISKNSIISDSTDFLKDSKSTSSSLFESEETHAVMTSIKTSIGFVADGTHRLVTAFLLGVDEILVSDEYPDLEDVDYCLITEIKFAEGFEYTGDLTEEFKEEINDVFFWKLRSLSMSDDFWVTASVGGGNWGNWTIYWDSVNLEIIDLINSEIQRRLAVILPNFDFDVKTLSEPLDDEDVDVDDTELTTI